MHGKSIEGTVASAIFVVLFFVMLIQIFGRTPLLDGPVWTEEAARWLWVWMAFLGIAAVERQDTQLRMGFLIDALPKTGRVILFTIIDLVYAAVAAHLARIGYQTVMRTWSNDAVTLPFTDAVLYASGALAFLLALHRIIRRIVARLRHGPTNHEPETAL